MIIILQYLKNNNINLLILEIISFYLQGGLASFNILLIFENVNSLHAGALNKLIVIIAN